MTSCASFFHLRRRTEAIDKQRRRALFLSYAADWVLTLVIAGLFFLLNTVEPFKREFSLDDVSIQYTFAVHERVSDLHLFLIAFIAPLVLMAITNVISIRSFWDLHTSWLGVFLALALAGSITNLVKVTGRPRPDCIDRCQPRLDSNHHTLFGLVNATICTQTDNSILKDGFRSFPSGHSSLSFAGLGFLSFYLAGKLHLFDQRGHTGKAWISVVPLMAAALVAISRTMDYRHHWHDVLVGSLLGLALAWFSYRQYYPPLSYSLCHRPYSPRISRNSVPRPRAHINSVDHFRETGEADTLQSPHDLHYSEQSEGIQLHGSRRVVTDDHLNAPLSLPELWEQGEELEITPTGQVQVPSSQGPVEGV